MSWAYRVRPVSVLAPVLKPEVLEIGHQTPVPHCHLLADFNCFEHRAVYKAKAYKTSRSKKQHKIRITALMVATAAASLFPTPMNTSTLTRSPDGHPWVSAVLCPGGRVRRATGARRS
jgi:hypothetical protein